ncbi:MAG TPA: TolC family protein [Gammaproteobacteria bacterium]
MKHWLYLMLVFLLTPIANAVKAQTSAPITLEQVIINTMEHNPQFGINDYETRAAAARIRQAQQSKPYELRLGLENFAGSGNNKGLDQLETTFSLAKILESGEVISSRSELANREATLLRNEQDSKRLDILAESTNRFIHVVIDQHRLNIAREKLELARHTHDIVTQRVHTGRSHSAEARHTAIALSRAEIELEHAEHELSTTRLKLTVSWGETTPQFSIAEANLFLLPQTDSFERLAKLLENNPELVRFATEERVTQARMRLAQSRRTPNLELSGGIRYFNAPNDSALVFSVGIPFGTGSRAQPEIDEMNYLGQREPLRYEQARLTLYSSLYEIYQELLHSRTAFEALSQHIIPQAEQAAKDYEQGYKDGRFSLLELNDAQKSLLDARLEKIMTAANHHRFRIEIERLTGAYLRPGEQP